MAKSGVVNLRGFINKLEKRIVKNPERKLKKMVQRSTALVEGTTKQSILKGGTGTVSYTHLRAHET